METAVRQGLRSEPRMDFFRDLRPISRSVGKDITPNVKRQACCAMTDPWFAPLLSAVRCHVAQQDLLLGSNESGDDNPDVQIPRFPCNHFSGTRQRSSQGGTGQPRASAIARKSSTSPTLTVRSWTMHSRQAARSRRLICALVPSRVANARSSDPVPHSAAGRKWKSAFGSCRIIAPRANAPLCRVLVPVSHPCQRGEDAGAFLLNAADPVNLHRSGRRWDEAGFQVAQQEVAECELEEALPAVGGGERPGGLLQPQELFVAQGAERREGEIEQRQAYLGSQPLHGREKPAEFPGDGHAVVCHHQLFLPLPDRRVRVEQAVRRPERRRRWGRDWQSPAVPEVRRGAGGRGRCAPASALPPVPAAPPRPPRKDGIRLGERLGRPRDISDCLREG